MFVPFLSQTGMRGYRPEVPNMTLTHIRYFLEAARCENFTVAAQNLFVSQPSMSKQIALMEREVGTALFLRSNHKVQLTPAGRYLYEQLSALFPKTERAIERARLIGQGFSGNVTVGVLLAQELNKVIMRRTRAFTDRYPEVEVQFERASFSDLRHKLLTGAYDLIITMSFEVEYIPGAKHETILSSRGAIAISRDNPKAAIEGLTLDMLKDENFVLISEEESPNGYALSIDQCFKHGFKPRIARKLSSLESLLLCVETGVGIAILDRNTRLEKDSSVRIVPIPGSEPSNVSAIWLESNHNPLAERLAKALSMYAQGD